MRHVLIHLHPDFSEELEEIIQKWNSAQTELLFHGIRPKREYEVKLLTKGSIHANESFAIASKIRKEPDIIQMMI